MSDKKKVEEEIASICRDFPHEHLRFQLVLDRMKLKYPDVDHSQWPIARILNSLKN